MKRGKPLARKAWRSRPKPTGPAQDAVEAVYERGSHSCEICGCAVGPQRGLDHHIHHRRPRAAGGSRAPETNLPSNLLLLCPADHRLVESNRAGSLAAGWLVRQGTDPAGVPVVIHGPRLVYLTQDGRYRAPSGTESS